MAVIALIGGKGSPGVTVSSLALSFGWPRPRILVEADPAGGDIRTGFLRHLDIPADFGLMQLVLADLRGQGSDLSANLINLGDQKTSWMLLPGIDSPTQAPSLNQAWDGLADLMAAAGAAEPGFDAIVDCGRIITPFVPWPILWRADAVLVVARPTASSLASAMATVRLLKPSLNTNGAGDRTLGMILVGSGDYQPAEIERAFARDAAATVDIVGTLPHDPDTARVLSSGGTVHRRQQLLRAAGGLAETVATRVDTHRARLQGIAQRGGAHV
jgi:hypothetical protein